jgi:hypothetical protein
MKILGIFVAAIALLWTAAVAFFLGLAPFALTGEVMFLAGLLPFVIVVSVVIAWQWPRYRRRRRWEDMARVLGLSRDGPDSLRRVYKGFTVRISGTQEGSSETVIAVDSGGRIPRDVVLERGGQDSPDVRTGDAPFDAFVRVRGDEAQALALLGAAARKTVAAGLSALYCRVQDGAVGFRTPEGLVQLALLRQWLDTLTDIATALVLDGSEVPARLTWNALNDPVPAVRLRNLVVLLQRFQQSDAAREAVHVASTSPDAELRREAARALEQRRTWGWLRTGIGSRVCQHCPRPFRRPRRSAGTSRLSDPGGWLRLAGSSVTARRRRRLRAKGRPCGGVRPAKRSRELMSPSRSSSSGLGSRCSSWAD